MHYVFPLLLLVSVCFVPGQSIAAHEKVTGSEGSGYVIQMGAFRDQKYAEELLSRLRSKGAEVYLARKDNGMYVVQSQSFTTRGKAHALAARLVAGKVVDEYFITTTSSKIVSKSSGGEGLSKSHPMEIVQDTPKETTERDTSKAANIPVEELFIQEFKLVKNSDNSEKYSAFVAEYDRNLKQCWMPGTFVDIASFFVKKAQPDKAIAIYRTLFSCSKDQDFRMGILDSLKPLIPARELLTMLEQERSAAAGSPDYLKKLDSFQVILLYALLETEPDKVEELAGAILALNPGDRVALKTLAWYHFRNDHYEEAYKYFSELNRIEPEQVDHVTGMIYALSEMKEFEKAMELAPAVNTFFYKLISSELKK
jgi:hypothetical protein